MKTVGQIGVILLLAAAPTGLAIVFHPEMADRSRAGLEAGAVRVAEVDGWNRDVLWIDARPAAEFARGSIPGAIPFDEANFEPSLGAALAAWQPGRAVVVYCGSTGCGTSKQLAARMREAGFEDVYYLHGGWEAWQASHSTARPVR